MTDYKRFIKVDPRDNVITLLHDLEAGDELKVDSDNCQKNVEINAEIKAGFKVAIKQIEKGGKIIKYGEVIGKATEKITVGEKVHIHNVEGVRGRGDVDAEGGV